MIDVIILDYWVEAYVFDHSRMTRTVKAKVRAYTAEDAVTQMLTEQKAYGQASVYRVKPYEGEGQEI